MDSRACGPDSVVGLFQAASKATSAAAYNIVNPSTITWPTVVPFIISACNVKLQTVSFPESVDAFQYSGSDPYTDSDRKDIEQNPALKLLKFLKAMEQETEQSVAVFSTDETVKASKILATLQSVRAEWIENWMKQWGFT